MFTLMSSDTTDSPYILQHRRLDQIAQLIVSLHYPTSMFHSTLTFAKTIDKSVKRQQVLASVSTGKEGMSKHVLFPTLWGWKGISKTHEMKFADFYIQSNLLMTLSSWSE